MAASDVFFTDISFAVNPWSGHCVFKFLKKCRQFCCTGLPRSSKLVHLDDEKFGLFYPKSVNLMILVLISKSNRKWPKIGKN